MHNISFITKPSILFASNDNEDDTPFGIFISIIAAFVSAIAIFVNKVVSKDFHYIISVYFPRILFFRLFFEVHPEHMFL